MTHVQSATKGENKLSEWHCDCKCRIVLGGAGPWSDENKELFFNVKHAHSKCIGFQKGELKLKGKANWGHTEIEKEYNNLPFANLSELLHNVIAYLKGPEKVCLIKEKWKWMN